MKTTTKVLKSTETSLSLRRKLQMCGSKTADGYFHFCRSPSCNRCRKHRAHILADAVSDWAVGQSSNRLHKIRIEMPSHPDPSSLLTGIQNMRRRLRGVFDRQQRQDDRWETVRTYGSFSPVYEIGNWSAVFLGVIHLGRVHEVTLLNAFEKAFSIRLGAFSKDVRKNDVYSYVHYTINNMSGLAGCSSSEIASYFNAINASAGFKSTIFRRGFQ